MRSNPKKGVRKINWKKRAIELAKKIVRSRGSCEWCGKSDGVLHGAHIVSVRYGNTAADTDNILCLCYQCHFYRWHSAPMETAAWFNSKWPGRYERLQEKARQITKPDFEEIYKKLKEEHVSR